MAESTYEATNLNNNQNNQNQNQNFYNNYNNSNRRRYQQQNQQYSRRSYQQNNYYNNYYYDDTNDVENREYSNYKYNSNSNSRNSKSSRINQNTNLNDERITSASQSEVTTPTSTPTPQTKAPNNNQNENKSINKTRNNNFKSQRQHNVEINNNNQRQNYLNRNQQQHQQQQQQYQQEQQQRKLETENKNRNNQNSKRKQEKQQKPPEEENLNENSNRNQEQQQQHQRKLETENRNRNRNNQNSKNKQERQQKPPEEENLNENSNRNRNQQQHQPPQQRKSSAVVPVKEIKIENETRTEILIEQLTKNKYECMVCCFVIKNDTGIWTCNVCHHIFHLFCIKKWARSSVAIVEENTQKWRCPGCQNVNETVPNKYTCFCGKKLNPEYVKELTPHCCGEVCGKPKMSPANLNCTHKCTLLCHPGPCPPCEVMVSRQCGCGKLKFQVKCNSNKVPQCDNICNKSLNCGLHKCELKCHPTECPSCHIDVEQKCYSHNQSKIVKCGKLEDPQDKHYKCGELCDKLLDCQEHRCEKSCHSGDCNACMLLPKNLKSCPCGKNLISDLTIDNPRLKCTDPIPTCEQKCEKVLNCSDFNNGELHLCQSKCHIGDCSKCERIVKVACRCGNQVEEMPCYEAQKFKKNPLMCTRRCTKKQACGRHRCTETCCNLTDHICTFICNRLLNCGKHNCEQLCHKGNCLKCSFSSYDEWICNCGQTIVYPPIKCGTKLPECPHPCSRRHECEHPPQHNCHSEGTCPPCSFLTKKMCMGGHEIRSNIPCYMKDVSCGLPCGKELPCGKHKCLKTCHKGPCLEDGEVCNQPCQLERPHCIHNCLSPCHPDKPCPDTVCQAQVTMKCKCGLKTKQTKCLQKFYDSSAVVFENLASEIKEMLSCKTIDLNSFRNTEVLKKKYELPCDEECFIAERNRNFAQALQIDPNNVTTKQTKPIYSEFLKSYAREDTQFAFYIEKELAQFIKDLNASKETKKCLNFPIMKSNQRRFIHELGPYYNVETQSHDKEPNRNVRVYATKDKSVIPLQTLTQSLEIKAKQYLIPHVSNAKQIKSFTNNVMPLMNQDDQFEIKPSSFAILANLSESDTDEIIYKNENNLKNNSKKDIDYFDFTD